MLTPYENECGQMAMGWNRAREKGCVSENSSVRVKSYVNLSAYSFYADLTWADTIIINSEISSAVEVAEGRWNYSIPKGVVDYAKTLEKNVIVVSIGKPYDVQFYDQADAILAVYGCMGSTIDPTEVLTNGTTHQTSAFGPNIVAGVEVITGVFGAQGKLPVDIPLYDFNNCVYTDTKKYDRGFGLTYNASGE